MITDYALDWEVPQRTTLRPSVAAQVYVSLYGYIIGCALYVFPQTFALYFDVLIGLLRNVYIVM